MNVSVYVCGSESVCVCVRVFWSNEIFSGKVVPSPRKQRLTHAVE